MRERDNVKAQLRALSMRRWSPDKHKLRPFPVGSGCERATDRGENLRMPEAMACQSVDPVIRLRAIDVVIAAVAGKGVRHQYCLLRALEDLQTSTCSTNCTTRSHRRRGCLATYRNRSRAP